MTYNTVSILLYAVALYHRHMRRSDSSAPTPTDVERIAVMSDPVARNHDITQCYHELAVAVARLLPGGANWGPVQSAV